MTAQTDVTADNPAVDAMAASVRNADPRRNDLVSQFTRYLIVGGIAFVFDSGSLYVLAEFGRLHYLAAAAIAFLLGLLVNYYLSVFWVFNKRTMDKPIIEFLIFAAIGVVGLGLNEAIIWEIREHLHWHYMIGKVFSAAGVLLWNFTARKIILFR
jgi:putative flippase GtrA